MSRFNIFICNYIFQYFEHHKFESFSPTMVGYTGLREDNDTHEETIYTNSVADASRDG